MTGAAIPRRPSCMEVASRFTAGIQITADGHWTYPYAIQSAFGHGVDSMWVAAQDLRKGPADRRTRTGRSAAAALRPCAMGKLRMRIIGHPDMDRVSISVVSLSNRSMRASMRRFTRWTNAGSGRAEKSLTPCVSPSRSRGLGCLPRTPVMRRCGGRRRRWGPDCSIGPGPCSMWSGGQPRRDGCIERAHDRALPGPCPGARPGDSFPGLGRQRA